MRKTARLKLEYIHLDSLCMTLTQALAECDSVVESQGDVITKIGALLMIKEDQILNLKGQYKMADEKYKLANKQITHGNKMMWLFVFTTVLMMGFLALSLL
jgi:hypothetical protein